jgi:hypothetical protein
MPVPACGIESSPYGWLKDKVTWAEHVTDEEYNPATGA